jgi:hypothetical protein
LGTGDDKVEAIIQGPTADMKGKGDIDVGFGAAFVQKHRAFGVHVCNSKRLEARVSQGAGWGEEGW